MSPARIELPNMLRVRNFGGTRIINVGIGEREKQNLSGKAPKMTHYDVPRDLFVDDGHDMKCSSGRLHQQPFDDGNSDGAKGFSIPQAKSDMEGSFAGYCFERAQDNLRRSGDRIVTCQFADARSVDRGNRRQGMEIN
ncbi:hypothetical protein [Brucella sp. 10RB9210]|uniref:hypothetical protein n=1 Tax=Brucella sp. 10RB9210 TaxID=1844037 RepID=UPI0012AEA77C|nr:hypothetical protein [Brucella sp. 10RB9210]MRN77867.1 hypothetical protein [Brucella sp. 10RB9210]